MPISPLVAKADLVTFTIKVGGSPIKDIYQIDHIQVSKAVNKVPVAKVALIDGSAQTETFEASESNDFVPGSQIEIQVGYHGQEQTIFKGLIVKHGVKVRSNKTSFLVLTCNDEAVKMTVGRKSAYYVKSKDSDVLSQLIGNAGLQASVASTTVEHEEIIQYFSTDWDFMVTRAEINGQIVVVDDGKVTVAEPDVSATPDLVVTYGDEVQEIDAEIDARSQLPSVTCTAWDLSAQQVASGDSQEPSVNKQGNLSGKKLAGVLGLDSYDLQSTGPVTAEALKTWANAQLLKSRLGRIRGTVSFQGNALPKPGTTIELKGLGARFNGNAFIARVDHRIAHGDWTTEVTFGLPPRWFTETQHGIEAPPASGLLPGMQGLHIGQVKKIDEDPDGAFRVQVTLPLIASGTDGVWARLATFYATNKAGAFFMPEIGDEVVLGFLNDDPRYPIILGSLYSKPRAAPFTPDQPNTNKGIVTNSQLKILFEDVKKVITIETPGGHTVVLSDEDQSITITDSNKNSIEMAPGGITIDSKADLTIKAAGNMNISSEGPMSIKSNASVKVEGPQVDLSAQMSLTAQSQGTATLKATANTTIQGLMVAIN